MTDNYKYNPYESFKTNANDYKVNQGGFLKNADGGFDGAQAAGIATGALGFGMDAFGYDGAMNPADIELQKERAIDSDNPMLDGSVYDKNMAMADKKVAGSKGLASAAKMTGSGAALGMTVGGPVGAAIGAGAGLLVGAVGGIIRKSKAKRAREEATNAMAKNVNQYNTANVSYNENRIQDKRISGMMNSYYGGVNSLI